MNKSGQVGLISLVFSLIAFVILWALYLGKWLSDWGQDMITRNSLTGIEAFLAGNLNLWVILGVIVGVLAWTYLGGRQ